MKMLIAYGTTEGQTGKIADRVADQVRAHGHEAVLLDTSKPQSDLRPETFDRVIVAGSVHEEQHQDAVEVFVLANRKVLDIKPTLFLSISLAAAFDNGQDDAQGYIDSFLDKVGWRPARSMTVAGAVRHGEYGYYREQILAHVVLAGRELDDPDADHEFTDWKALETAVDAFLEG